LKACLKFRESLKPTRSAISSMLIRLDVAAAEGVFWSHSDGGCGLDQQPAFERAVDSLVEIRRILFAQRKGKINGGNVSQTGPLECRVAQVYEACLNEAINLTVQ
jgi:hypothetical protein